MSNGQKRIAKNHFLFFKGLSMKILPFIIMFVGINIMIYDVSILTAVGVVLTVLAGVMFNIDDCKDQYVKKSKWF